MANSKIKQILVGTTTYDIEDASAAKLASNNTFTGDNTFEGKNYFSYKTYLGTLADNVAELSFKDDTTGYPTPEKAYIRAVIQAGAEYNGRPTIDFVNTEGGSNRDIISLTKWDKSNEHYYRTALENAVSSDPGNTGRHSAAISHCELDVDTGAPTNQYRATFPLKSGTVALTSDIDVTAAGDNTFTGTNTFSQNTSILNSLCIKDSASSGSKKILIKAPGTDSSGSICIYDTDAARSLVLNLPSMDNAAHTIATQDNIDEIVYRSNTFTGDNTFNKHISLQYGPESYIDFGNGIKFYGNYVTKTTDGTTNYNITFPIDKTGSHTLATTSDIPDTSNFVTLSGVQEISGNKTFTGINRFTGTNTFTTILSCANGIVSPTIYPDSGYTLTVPKKDGTLATTSDIPIKTATLSGTTLSITLS